MIAVLTERNRVVLPDGDFLVKAGRYSWCVNSERLCQSPFFNAAIQGQFKVQILFLILLVSITNSKQEATDRSITIEEVHPELIGYLIQWLYFGMFSHYEPWDFKYWALASRAPSVFRDMPIRERKRWYYKIMIDSEDNNEDKFGDEDRTQASEDGIVYQRIPLDMYEIGERFMLPKLQKFVVKDLIIKDKLYRRSDICQKKARLGFNGRDSTMIEAALHRFKDLVKPFALTIAHDLRHFRYEKEWHSIISRHPELAVAVTVELTEILKRVDKQLEESQRPQDSETCLGQQIGHSYP